MIKFWKHPKNNTIVEKDILKDYNNRRIKKNIKPFCLAPYSSMMFSLSGSVIPCCLNRGFIYGKYPENNLHDIWFGNNIRKFRNLIQKFDLSEGCHLCEFHLKNKSFGQIHSNDFDWFKKSKTKQYPSLLEFNLSNNCNLQCKMCSGEFSSTYRANIENKAPYKSPYDAKFFEQLEEFIPHLKQVRFIGGEPFLINEYYQLWERIISINPKIEIIIITNGTVLNQKIKELLEKGLFYFSISLESISKEIYEKIRINAKFEQFQSNFDYFYNYSKKNNRWLGIAVCPIQQNWTEIPDLLRWANEKDIYFYLNDVYFPHFATIQSLNAIKIQEIINFLSLQVFDKKANSEVFDQNILIYDNLIKTLVAWKLEAELRKKSIEKMQVNEMKELFMKRLSDFIKNKNTLSDSEKNEKIIRHIETCKNVFEAFKENENVLAKALYNLGNIPIQTFYAEIEINDIDRLIGRFLQSGI